MIASFTTEVSGEPGAGHQESDRIVSRVALLPLPR
jgi:hypothetical protein